MEKSNSDSDSDCWCPMNHSQNKDKENDKGKVIVFDVSNSCGCDFSNSKSKALVLYDDVATTAAASSSNCHRHRSHRNPRKRRSKLITFVDETTASTNDNDNNRFLQGSFSKRSVHLKPKNGSKKPDPSAPKITRPCSECGKTFWSWKALFGHMRCHPERQWRGINPPPNFLRQPSSSSPANKDVKDDTFFFADSDALQFPDGSGGAETMFTHDEREVASCLLLLRNGEEAQVEKGKANIPQDETTHNDMYAMKVLNWGFAGGALHAGTAPFEEDGGVSHQALGDHRASHKYAKGRFAITRTASTSENAIDYVGDHHDQTQNHNHDNLTSIDGGDYHCYQTDQSQSTTSVLLQEEQPLDCKDSTTNATDSTTVIALGNGHRCSICSRIFSSGQALGGHKRCHWEKTDNETLSVNQGITSPLAVAAPSGAALNLKKHSNVDGADNKKGLDLNLPAPLEDDSSSSYSSPLTLDLRLGI